MKTKTRFQKRMQKVWIITLCWTLFMVITSINQYFFVVDLIDLQKVSGYYEFWPDFIGQTILGAVGGLVGGYLLVFKMESRYKQRSFAFGIINIGLYFIVFYVATAVFALFFMAFIYNLFQMNFVAAFHKSWNNLMVNLNTASFFISMCMWGILVSATQFMLQVNDKFGQGVLWKFMTGKYYHPRQEERIFMFLDLRASTTIAEKIGSQHFFELLREIYQDITEPIMNSLGEIYQYVGDEVVVTWSMENGLKENNCLSCFFHIEKALEARKAHYLKKYGLLPSLKAGMHVGEATVGEIGVIKKDIVFSGDVLNTTSRIQGECNHHGANVLISAALLQRLPMNGMYQRISIGELSLRGKVEKVALHTVKMI